MKWNEDSKMMKNNRKFWKFGPSAFRRKGRGKADFKNARNNLGRTRTIFRRA